MSENDQLRPLLLDLVKAGRSLTRAIASQAKAINNQAGAINHLADTIDAMLTEGEGEAEDLGGLNDNKRGRIIPQG